MIHLKTNQGTYTARKETIEDKEYLVAPVVMMLEGVHSGSAGALLHTSSELSKNVDAWEDVPVTIHHPQASDGTYISANSEGVQSVGVVRNAEFTGGKLRAEVWLDTNKLIAINPTVHQHILNGNALDVSIGVFSEDIEVAGTWNDEEYTAIATNYTPDHLALLPGDTGACSWKDGCGIRANSENQNKNQMEKTDYKAQVKLHTNVEGYQARLDAAYSMVNALDNDAEYHWLEDMYDNYLVYRKRQKDGQTQATYHKQNYTMGTDGSIVFNGEPIQVKRNLSYEAVTANAQNKSQTNKKETKVMSKSDCFMKKVDGLIANTQTRFTEDQRSWLEQQDETTLELLEPKMVRTNKEEKEEAVIDDTSVAAYLAEKSEDEALKLLPEALRVNAQNGLKAYQEARKEKVTAIMANTKDVWEEEELNAMSDNQLDKLVKSVQANKEDDNEEPEGGDFGGKGAEHLNANAQAGEEFLPPVTAYATKQENK